ncbi:hypothetical protein EV426DRAFT_429882 [Tirmania nivea]|nr:hypothetical protein EV426DRAFT_429882 [Tirmania nivea]
MTDQSSIKQRRRLRVLVPKGPCNNQTTYDPALAVQGRLQPGRNHEIDHNYNQQQKSLARQNVNSQVLNEQLAYAPLQPNSNISSLAQKHDAAVPPCTNFFSDTENIGLGVGTPKSLGFSAQHLPYDYLQLQETFQNHTGHDYWVPGLDTSEVAFYAVQQNIGVHQIRSSHPTVDQQLPVFTQQLLPVQPAHHASLQQNSHYLPCVNCPSTWCFHLESIMLSDPQDKGIHNIKRSYRDLRQHIQESHLWQYGTACTLCEDLFCNHGGILILLETAEGDFAGLKIDLRRSFMILRDHIKDAHGGC